MTVLTRIAVGRPDVLGRGLVRGVDLAVVVAAELEVPEVEVGEVLDELRKARVGAEEVLPHERPALDVVALPPPVDDGVEALDQEPRARREASSGSHSRPRITLMTFHPEPRNTASSSWMIFPFPRTGPSRRWRLQLTTKIRLSSPSLGGHVEGAERLRLVGLAVAEERPDARAARCPSGRGCAGSG